VHLTVKSEIALKQSIKNMRREELVRAAISVIAGEGLAAATLANIATRAGMSPALVNHYFDGKDELLAMTLQKVSSLLRQEILKLLPPSPTPEQRLEAIINGNFLPQLYVSGAQEAWLQFSLLSKETDSRHMQRIDRIVSGRFSSNIGYAFRQLLPPARVNDATDGLIALIDGFSWRFLMDPACTDFELARRICWDYVQMQIHRGTAAFGNPASCQTA
jgi:TetR/AcrR family transcriptional repressor of bet genes